VRVLHVIGIYPPSTHHSGPPQQVHALAQHLPHAGVDVGVLTTNANGPDTLDVPVGRWATFEGVRVFYGRRLPATREASWQTWRAIAREARSADLIHATAIFSWFNVAVEAAARRAGIPYVISPRGSLDPEALTFSRAKKAVFFALGGRRALDRASALHVTSEMEDAHVRRFLPGARIGIVPNGVAVPSDAELTRVRSGATGDARILYLGRIHPKKNLTALVRAWSRFVAGKQPATLSIVGPDDHGHRAEIARLIAAEGATGSVRLEDRVDGEAKHRLLAGARALVLPSHTENFGNVVAEALAHGTPAIASTGTPWSGLREHACGWWIDPTEDNLGRAMSEALALPSEARAEKGERGRRWVSETLSWPSVTRSMIEFYEDVLSHGRGAR
jgi:glycosyltransferase involved in cell wall biosynthesis